MNTKVEKLDNNIVKMEITVEAAKFSDALKKSYFRNAKKFNVPGFRKGRAPMNIIKRYYGESVLYEDAINICCQDTYPQAVDENKIKPVDYPKIDIVQIGDGKDLIYSAEVIVEPEIELGKYKGVEVKPVHYDVKDEEIEEQLKNMQEKNARIKTKEDDGIVEKGNVVSIDFKGFIDGEAFKGGEASNYSLEIGSGTFIDTFEDQLVGLKKGDEKDVQVTFPEEYGRDDLNGKPATFKVKINEIRIKEVPDLDDEFATEVSEFDTLDELKADIKKKLQENNDRKAKQEYEDSVIDAVCDNVKVDIPEVMVKKEIDSMMKDLEMRLKYQGMNLESYYKYTNNDEEKVRDYMKVPAEKKVKTELVLDKISKEENVQVSDEEILERAKEIAKQYGKKDKDIDKTAELIAKNQREYVEAEIINEKVIKMLVNESKTIA